MSLVSLIERSLSTLDGVKNILTLIHFGASNISDKLIAWSVDKEAGICKYPFFYLGGLALGGIVEYKIIQGLSDSGDFLGERVDPYLEWVPLLAYGGLVVLSNVTARIYDGACREEVEEE